MKLSELYLCFGFNIYVVLQKHFDYWYVTPGYSMVEGCIPTEIHHIWISFVVEQYRNTNEIVSLSRLWKFNKKIHLQFKESKREISTIALNRFP